MRFCRSPRITAPEYDHNLPWPIIGLAYVAFLVPMPAGLFPGFVTRDWAASVVGLLLGTGITVLNGFVMERFLEPWIAKHQKHLYGGVARVCLNSLAFAWAFVLSGLAMVAPFVIFGSRLLIKIERI